MKHRQRRPPELPPNMSAFQVVRRRRGEAIFNPCSKLRSRERGQGMVEFVFLLTILMTVCAGMLYASRLLTAEFWAQQESRFLAFEQDWIGAKAYSGSSFEGAKSFLASEGSSLRRPPLLDQLEPERKGEKSGGLTDLLAALKPYVGARSHLFSGDVVPVAYASKGPLFDFSEGEGVTPRPRDVRPRSSDAVPNPRLAERVSNLLTTVSFGEGACDGMLSGVPLGVYEEVRRKLSNPSCSAWINKRFGEHLARTVSIPAMTREFDLFLGDGVPVEEAFQKTLRGEVARGFYSFFDTTVKTSFEQAEMILTAGKVEPVLAVSDGSFTRMLSKMRYLGALGALSKIAQQSAEVVGRNVSSRNVQQEKAFEDAVRGVLNEESSGTDYLLLAKPPVPPELTPLAGGLFSGLMRMALSQDAGLLGVSEALTDVYESNAQTEVSFDVGKGLFPAIRRRFNTENIRLRSRFYLVTSPWHIDRRVNGTGEYREVGDELDTVDDDSDEGQLRRRVAGFWLLPTPASGLIEPFAGALGVEGVSPLFATVDALSGILGMVKQLLVDNPLNKIFEAIQDIPGFSGVEPPLPQWPAVRPQAYPGSGEIEGDKLMAGSGEGRTFEDYIDEQREFNPEPDPKFHEDE